MIGSPLDSGIHLPLKIRATSHGTIVQLIDIQIADLIER
jgi:hypothetical protein